MSVIANWWVEYRLRFDDLFLVFHIFAWINIVALALCTVTSVAGACSEGRRQRVAAHQPQLLRSESNLVTEKDREYVRAEA
jgi:hypothetical protein